MPWPHVVGVAYDGSPEARAAVDVAAELGLASGAALRLIGVAEPPPKPTAGMSAVYLPDGDGECREALRRDLETVAEDLPASLRTQVVLVGGDAATQLIEQAGALSLLVMGSRGFGPVLRTLLGSVSAQILRAAPCPVLIVPPAAARAHRSAA
jgi:nucleotide-binding universal stress UspA family protein